MWRRQHQSHSRRAGHCCWHRPLFLGARMFVLCSHQKGAYSFLSLLLYCLTNFGPTVCVCMYMYMLSPFSLTLCDSMACSLPGSSLSMGFSRQRYWSELPFPPPGDLHDSGIEPRSPALQADSLPLVPPGKPHLCTDTHLFRKFGVVISFF